MRRSTAPVTPHIIGKPSPELVEAFTGAIDTADLYRDSHDPIPDLEYDPTGNTVKCSCCGCPGDQMGLRPCDQPAQVTAPPLSEDFVPVDLATGPGRVQEVPLGLCRPSPYNPRIFPQRPSEKLVDLAKSIRRTGQVQAATVRPMKAGLPDPETGDITTCVAIPPGEPWTPEQAFYYEIVAGERRWRAASLARDAKGLTGEQTMALDEAGPAPAYLRAEIRELTDEQAMEICAVENLDREDLTPLEEANGVTTLMSLYRADVEAVAARLNRTTSWVAARVRLTHLSAKWKKALADTERGFQGWTAAHLAEIAKLEPASQDALLNDLHSPARMTVQHVRGLVSEVVKVLGGAPFDTADSLLVPRVGACTTCPATSINTPGLFTDMGDDLRPTELAKARCLNPVCWQGKAAAAAKAKLAELRRTNRDAVVVFDSYQEQRQMPNGLNERAVSAHNFERVKADTKGAFPGVYAAGPKVGKVEWFKKPERVQYGSKAKPEGPTPLKKRRADLLRRRKKLAVETIAAQVEKSDLIPAGEVLMALAAAFGTKNRRDTLNNWGGHYDGGGQEQKEPWKAFDKLRQAQDGERNAALWKEVRPVLLGRLTYTGSGCDVDKLYFNAKCLADLVALDAKAALDAATEAIREPKSWALLNDDGTPKKAAAARKKGAAPAAKVPRGRRAGGGGDQDGAAPAAEVPKKAPRRRRAAAPEAATA